jgi:DNA-binding MarR family transcriptional regulator
MSIQFPHSPAKGPRTGRTVQVNAHEVEVLEWLTAQLTEAPARCGNGGTRQASELAERAEGMLRRRQVRSLYFPRSMFSEPAWDILLALYVAECAGLPTTVSNLAVRVQVPTTSSLRWLGYLEAQGLIGRTAHPTDRRASLVQLTDKGRADLETYLSQA